MIYYFYVVFTGLYIILNFIIPLAITKVGLKAMLGFKIPIIIPKEATYWTYAGLKSTYGNSPPESMNVITPLHDAVGWVYLIFATLIWFSAVTNFGEALNETTEEFAMCRVKLKRFEKRPKVKKLLGNLCRSVFFFPFTALFSCILIPFFLTFSGYALAGILQGDFRTLLKAAFVATVFLTLHVTLVRNAIRPGVKVSQYVKQADEIRRLYQEYDQEKQLLDLEEERERQARNNPPPSPPPPTATP
jgi:hypothetical protein